MKFDKLTAFFLVGLMITIALTAIIPHAGGEPPVRGPDEKTGHITADETWSTDYQIKNLVIDEGVTVTVGPGIHLYLEADTWFYVEGTLIFNGNATHPVNVQCTVPSMTWTYFVTNETGTLLLENFTITGQSKAHASFLHHGQPSVFKNGIINEGCFGLYLWDDGGDIIENLTIRDQAMDGLYINGNTERIYVKDLTLFNITRGALFLLNSEGCTVDGMIGYYGNYGVYTFNVNGLYLNDIDLRGKFLSSGFVTLMDLNDLQVTNSIVREGGIGVSFNTNPGSTANFTNLVIADQVGVGIQPYAGAYIEANFFDSDISAGGAHSIVVSSSGPPQRINLINTTWDWSKPIFTAGDVIVNVSWYMEGMLVDLDRNPINGTLTISPTGSPHEILTLISDGKFGKMEVKDKSIPDLYNIGNVTELFSYDLLFEYAGNPEDNIQLENIRFENYTWLRQVMNLRPTNTMPEQIVVQEDEELLFPLDDDFQDPEHRPLEYTIRSGADIITEIANGMNEMRIVNIEPNWNGESWVNISATDGFNSTYANVTVVIEPVNDPPELVEDLPIIQMEEDGEAYFNFSGRFIDADGDPFVLTFQEYEQFIMEYNETTMNLSLISLNDLHGLTSIQFTVSDGKDPFNLTIQVNVTPVNDAPIFTPPENWNVTIVKGSGLAINLTDMIWDIEGDELTITADPSDHLTLDGFNITLEYPAGYVDDRVSINISVSDGELSTMETLTIYLLAPPVVDDDDDDDIVVDDDDDDIVVDDDDDDDDIIDTVDSIKVIPGEDSWKIEVEGDEEQTLFLVIEDSEGVRTSYPLEYKDALYKAEIPADDGGEGYDFWISTEEDGGPLVTAPQGNLPGLKEKEDNPFPIWIIILIIVVLIIFIGTVIVAMSRGKGEEGYEE